MSRDGDPFTIQGRDEAILLLHGFTGTPHELQSLGEHLAAIFGWQVSAPLLPGHGTTIQDLSSKTVEDWQETVAQSAKALLQNFSRIHLLGLSMGGSLALDYYQSNSDRVASLALLSPTLWVRSWKDAFNLWLASHMPLPTPFHVRKKKESLLPTWIGYDSYSIPAVQQFNRLTKKIRSIPKINDVPGLIVYSEGDETAHPKSAHFLARRLTHEKSRLVRFESAPHVITLSEERGALLHEVEKFYRDVTSLS